MMEIPDNVLKFEVDDNGCWIWTDHTDEAGYGRQRVGKRMWIAHRLYVTLALGVTLTRQEEVDHLCRVRSCVNPDHLEVVTRAENNRRKDAAHTHCRRGHELSGDNLRSKITAKGGIRKECRACERLLAQRKKDQLKAAA